MHNINEMAKRGLEKISTIKISWKKKNLVAAVVLVAAAAALGWGIISGNLSILPKTPDQVFAADVAVCNNTPKEERFSCYRATLDRYYKANPDEGYFGITTKVSFHNSDPSSYAIFGTNCHTFYHSLGDYIAVNLPDDELDDSLASCPTSCTGGCVMGLMKRVATAKEFSADILKNLFDQCPKDLLNQCAHEVGHLLNDKYTSSILEVLDGISSEKYNITYPEYQYVTTTERNMSAPFDDCREIIADKALQRQCFTGVGHNLFLFAEFSADGFKGQFDECAKVDNKEDVDNCYAFLLFRIGINRAATSFLAKDIEGGNKVCDENIALIGREDLKYHCYLGLGGGIGLFIDSEFDLASVKPEGISSSQEVELLDRASLCDQATEKFVNDCYRGLLGTRFKKVYQFFKYRYPKIDEILGPLDKNKDAFQVVG